MHSDRIKSHSIRLLRVFNARQNLHLREIVAVLDQKSNVVCFELAVIDFGAALELQIIPEAVLPDHVGGNTRQKLGDNEENPRKVHVDFDYFKVNFTNLS